MKKLKVFFSGSIIGSYRAQNLIKAFMDNGAVIIYMPISFLVDTRKKLLNLALEWLIYVLLFPARLFYLARSKCLVVLPMSYSVCTIADIFIARLMNKKIIVDFYISIYDTIVNDKKEVESSSLRARYLMLKDRILMRFATHIFFLNNAERDYYTTVVGRELSGAKCIINPLCIDPKPTAIRGFGNGVKQKLTICWWGTYLPLHGLDKIIHSMKFLEDEPVELVIIGNSEEKSLPYQALVDKLGMQDIVTIRNDMSFSDGKLSEFLRHNCDLALGNFGDSKKAKTVLVNKVVDSIAMGIPCLTMETEGATQFMQDNIHVFYVANSPVEIAEKVKSIIRNKNYLNQISENLKEVYDAYFSQDAFRSRINAVIRML